MILDTQTKFSDAQAITATAISTNILDLRQQATPALADEGIHGADIWLNVMSVAAFNNLTSITVTLESDSNPNMATAPVVHATYTIPLASLTAGNSVIRQPIPSADYKRYLAVRYTVTGTAPSTGTVTAFLSTGIQRNIIYPTAFTVA